MSASTVERKSGTARPGELERLKRVPILTVAKDLGIGLRNGTCRCPLPNHDDRSPSCHVKAGANTWRCYACGVGGSVIDLVMHVSGCDFSRAVAWMRNRYLSDTAIFVRVDRLVSASRSVVTGDFHPDPEVYESILDRCPLGPEGITYFAGRAISEVTLRSFHAGQVGNRAELLRAAIATYGFVRVRAAGLLTTRSSPRHPACVFPAESVLFPFFRKGRCEYLQARSIGGSNRRWINLLGIPSPLFNADILDNPSAKDVVLCEGISDALSAAQMGRNAIGILGAGACFSDSDASLLRGKDVYIVADVDAAGKKMSLRLYKQLVDLGVHPTIQHLPEGCSDLNEYLVWRRRGADQ